MSTKSYQIWLTYNNKKTKFQFPVNPEKINVKSGNNVDTLDIPGFGELILKRGKKALEFSFDSFFPKHDFQGVLYDNFPSPNSCIKTIETIKNGTKKCKFVFTAIKANLYVEIVDFQWYEEGGDVGTYHYSITLKEAQSVKATKLKVSKSKHKAQKTIGGSRPSNKVVPKTYKIKSGDTLQKISKKYYGTTTKWQDIYKKNKSKLKNPDKLKIGVVISLP